MDNKEKILKAEELLKVNKQENVLNFFKKLSEDKQIKLAEEIINLNFEQLNKLYAETKTEQKRLFDRAFVHRGSAASGDPAGEQHAVGGGWFTQTRQFGGSQRVPELAGGDAGREQYRIRAG